MKTGWIKLEDENDDSDYTESWFYFDRSGKRVENQVDKKIDGAYYTFEDGRMQTGWYKLPADETASASEAAPATDSVAGYQYYDEDGKRASGWRESARRAKPTASTLRTVSHTPPPAVWSCSLLTLKSTHLTPRVRCRPASRSSTPGTAKWPTSTSATTVSCAPASR